VEGPAVSRNPANHVTLATPLPLSSRPDPDFLPRAAGKYHVCGFPLKKTACSSSKPRVSTGNPGELRRSVVEGSAVRPSALSNPSSEALPDEPSPLNQALCILISLVAGHRIRLANEISAARSTHPVIWTDLNNRALYRLAADVIRRVLVDYARAVTQSKRWRVAAGGDSGETSHRKKTSKWWPFSGSGSALVGEGG
jgi:hypothetical protein